MAARLTDRERALRTMTEGALQSTIEGLLTVYGWRWYHAPDNKPIRARSGKTYVQNIRAGYPDLTAVRGPRLLYIELKRQGPQGVVTPEQQAWLDDFAAAGAEVYVWRPGDIEAARATLSPSWTP